MKPASTSPEPAVASVGGAWQPIEARPPGSATTVSGPFSRTTAPRKAAAARARASLSEAAATAYGLAVLKRDMHDDPDNATRFALFRKAGG